MNGNQRRAVIDIGSNSVRLVVFGGALRAPVVLYNEKLSAGLGAGVVKDGRLHDEAMGMALRGLERFRLIAEAWGVGWLRVVATAAVREARNGQDFLDRVRALGLQVELLSGKEEARCSGYGVLSAIPDADGLVADLGGGSLDLSRIEHGDVTETGSIAIGAIKARALSESGKTALGDAVRKGFRPISWLNGLKGRPLYLVGGPWRALARVHMEVHQYPLPVLARYEIAPAHAAGLAAAIARMTTAELKAIPEMPSARVPMLQATAQLLGVLVDIFRPSTLVICPFGLREGLLFDALTEEQKSLDPLIEGVTFATADDQQPPGFGDAMANWLDILFDAEPAHLRRLRRAVCQIAGVGWSSTPAFRALTGEEMALHGNWIGVTAVERATMAMALHVGLGGDLQFPPALVALAPTEALETGRNWGLAIRLADRLAGGSTAVLERSLPSIRDGRLVLQLPEDLAALDDPTLRRRLQRLVDGVGLRSGGIETRGALSPAA